MRDAELLQALKNERDHQIFQQRCEAFVRRWAPLDPRDGYQFTGDLMSLFRDLILTQGIVHQQVAGHYFDKNMTTLSMMPMAPVIIKPEEMK